VQYFYRGVEVTPKQAEALGALGEDVVAMKHYVEGDEVLRSARVKTEIGHPLKYDEGKYDPTLVEPWVTEALSKIYQEGIDKKYSRGSWKKFTTEEAEKLMAPAIRHLDKDRSGERIDPDGGNPHILKAVWNLLTIYYHREVKKE
jgi:hypothetical protein